jgi:hypothetical protein
MTRSSFQFVRLFLFFRLTRNTNNYSFFCSPSLLLFALLAAESHGLGGLQVHLGGGHMGHLGAAHGSGQGGGQHGSSLLGHMGPDGSGFGQLGLTPSLHIGGIQLLDMGDGHFFSWIKKIPNNRWLFTFTRLLSWPAQTTDYYTQMFFFFSCDIWGNFYFNGQLSALIIKRYQFPSF